MAQAQQESAFARHSERVAAAVQVPRQVLSGGRERRNHTGHHVAHVLLASERFNTLRRNLLSARDLRATRLLCHSGQIRRLQPRHSLERLLVQRQALAQEVGFFFSLCFVARFFFSKIMKHRLIK